MNAHDVQATKATLDQQRARYAWQRACRNGMCKGYPEMVKGAATLIMSNGLMAALAYYQTRSGSNKDVAALLRDDILAWLLARQRIASGDFAGAMQSLLGADGVALMGATAEVIAMLKWLRQFADAVGKTS